MCGSLFICDELSCRRTSSSLSLVDTSADPADSQVAYQEPVYEEDYRSAFLDETSGEVYEGG
jgi:hypothetical protein